MAVATMPPSEIGRIEAAGEPVLGHQPVGDAKYPAEIADILAENQHIRIAGQHDIEGGIKRLDHVHGGHVQPPTSRHCSIRRQSGAL